MTSPPGEMMRRVRLIVEAANCTELLNCLFSEARLPRARFRATVLPRHRGGRLPRHRRLCTLFCLAAIAWAGCGGAKLHATAPAAAPAAPLRRRRAAGARGVRRHRRSAGALAGAVRRGGARDAPPALHQLPSRRATRRCRAIRRRCTIRRSCAAPTTAACPGLECATCHQDRNLRAGARARRAEVAPRAAASMAWVGRTPHAICEQIKDPTRNGGRTLAQIVEHIGARRARRAGAGRPARTASRRRERRRSFGALMAAWVETGAACPREETQPMSIELRVNGTDAASSTSIPRCRSCGRCATCSASPARSTAAARRCAARARVHLDGEAVRACVTPVAPRRRPAR